jgi:hypothetical protein
MSVVQALAFARERRWVDRRSRELSGQGRGRPTQRLISLPAKFGHAGDHGCSRRYAQLAEDPPHVGAYGPRADIENRRDHFVGVTLGNQTDDFELARAETTRISRGRGQSHDKISPPANLLIHQDAFRCVVGTIREFVQAADQGPQVIASVVVDVGTRDSGFSPRNGIAPQFNRSSDQHSRCQFAVRVQFTAALKDQAAARQSNITSSITPSAASRTFWRICPLNDTAMHY